MKAKQRSKAVVKVDLPEIGSIGVVCGCLLVFLVDKDF